MKSRRCAAALAAAAILILASCVGAGEKTAPTVIPPSGPSSAEIKAEMNALIARSDTIIEELSPTPLFLPITGSERNVWPVPRNYSLRSIAYNPFGDRSLAADGEYEFGGEEGGISQAGAAWESTEIYGVPRREQVNIHFSYGAWMEHSFFLVMQTMGLDPLDDYISVHPDILSIGAASGTNPARGSATWTGIMVGVDEDFAGRGISRFVDDEDWNVYGGTATLALTSFENPMVDVRFTEITNVATERRLRDVTWRGLPVTDGGFEGAGILGRFYGPHHEEVGGVFQFSTINGAFGAVRE